MTQLEDIFADLSSSESYRSELQHLSTLKDNKGVVLLLLQYMYGEISWDSTMVDVLLEKLAKSVNAPFNYDKKDLMPNEGFISNEEFEYLALQNELAEMDRLMAEA